MVAPVSETKVRPRRAGVWAAGSLGAGYAAARWLSEVGLAAPSWALLALAAALGVAGALARGRLGAAALCAAAAAFGAGVWTARVVETAPHSMARWLGEAREVRRVEGFVVDPPEVRGSQRGALARFARYDPEAWRFRVRVFRAADGDGGWARATGQLWVRADGAPVDLRAGDRVRLTGFARALRAPMNPGEPDQRPGALSRGIVGSIAARAVERVGGDEPGAPAGARARAWLDRVFGAARARARAVVDGAGPEGSRRASLAAALLLGERDAGYHELAAPFTRTGLAHVLAISGLHLGILTAMVGFLVRLTGDRPCLEAAIVLLSIALVLLLVPARTPIVRAAVILAGLRVAALSGRRYDALNVLGWVMLGVLLWRPAELWGAGFQLSFGIVAALVAFAAPARARLFGAPRDPDHRTAAGHARSALADATAAALVAWVVAAGVVGWRFGVFPVYGALASVVVVPVIGLALAVGYAGMAAALVAPGLAPACGAAIGAGSSALAALVDGLDALPLGAARLPALGGAWALAATLSGVAVFWSSARARRAGMVGLAVCAAWAAGRAALPGPGAGVALRWDALSVGDGSAHLLRAGRDAVLFDCGSSWFGVGRRTIPDAARALGARSVRTVIVSHPDTDHYSGLLDARWRLGVRLVLVGASFEAEAARDPGGPAAFTLASLRRAGVEVRVARAGDAVAIGPARLVFVGPDPGAPADASDNDTSLVALVEAPTGAGTRRVLMTGDIERGGMRFVEGRLAGVAIDAMEAPHHGSARPFALDFVGALDPGVVAQSTGPRRLGDERWDGVKAGRVWLTTASGGAAWVTVGRDGSVRSGSFRGR